MKRIYIKPDIKAIPVMAKAMFAGSIPQWDKDEQAGVDNTPGTQDDYGAKEYNIDDLW